MARVRATTVGKSRLYLTRDQVAMTAQEIGAECIPAAYALGYIDSPVEIGRVPRGGVQGFVGPKQQRAMLQEKTVPELREIAEEQGVELPAGYVKKEELLGMIKADEYDQPEEPTQTEEDEAEKP